MEHKEEYHDPDYPEAPAVEKPDKPKVSQEDNIQTIKTIIRREFQNELDVREREVNLIDQRMSLARRYLHELRYAVVNSYYNNQKLQLSATQVEDEVAAQTEPRARSEVSSILRNTQPRIHPSVQKLLGKKSVAIEEIFKSRAPRKTRRDYGAMVQKRNYTISADETKSLRPDKNEPGLNVVKTESNEHEDRSEAKGQVPSSSRPKKIPRQIDPKVNNVITVDEVTRNQMKHRYRVIIGNTSKYAPPASRCDRSTHKWLLYVRGAPVVEAITVRLHHSYAPHDTVHIDKPPFQVCRRGWGEFPALVTLHFLKSYLNRPATITHTIKLDRQYTGLQTLGAETVVDVWLYSTPDMIEHQQRDEEVKEIKEEVKEEVREEENRVSGDDKQDSWLEFFAKDTSQVNVDEMLVKNEIKTETVMDKHGDDNDEVSDEVKNTQNKRIMKYIEPTTGKIYYLEMDRALDLTKVQEIVINSEGNVKTAKISPLKTNGLKTTKNKESILRSLLKTEDCDEYTYDHIENDHCYLASDWYKRDHRQARVEEARDKSKSLVYSKYKDIISKFTCVKSMVSYLLKHMPLVSEAAGDAGYVSMFPFVVTSDDRYWKLDFAKRRNMEWSRAKLINKLLTETFKADPGKVWRTKQILVYSRLHGYYPIRREKADLRTDEWSSWNDLDEGKSESNIREVFPNESDLSTLSVFNKSDYVTEGAVVDLDVSGSDEEIEIVGDVSGQKKPVLAERPVSDDVLPVDSSDRLRFLFIEKVCEDIGIVLRNEDIGHGYSYSSVHSVLLSATKCFAEELIRSSLARQLTSELGEGRVWVGWSRPRVCLQHVFLATSDSRLQLVTSSHLAAAAHTHTPPPL
ncbi:uncharacterized protein LOC116776290 [Danaus plexippus]|uniref:uncharacterized protein LOC116776290 n=1 Tax=Danaus plexippus TaxID=13037 RepID=UPI002AB255B5|nr:uncharacterized protein LOC116776290 [Danaus plexippus]